jgi:XTP/dITP diphosphohydrolase
MVQLRLMKQLLFATTNPEKFITAKHTCATYDIEVTQARAEIIEIQAQEIETIARDKGTKAFTALKSPVVVTDDSWAILGLKGFPGPYMHSINDWFTPEDFLRLTSSLKDRRVVLTQNLIYTDEHEQKVFMTQSEGRLLKEIRGTSSSASYTIISLPDDEGLSLAEVYANDSDKSARAAAKVWHDFAQWFSEK